MYGEYLPQAVCAGQQWSMKLKVRAVHGQLNDGGFDSQRYAIAQHQPLTGRFLQASVIEPNCSLRAQYLASLQTTLQPYPWNAVILGLGMGNGYPSPKKSKYHARYWNGAFNGDIGIAHRFCGVAGCRTHSQWTNFSAWALDPLANTINWRNLLCCFYAWLTGMQPPALRTMVALATWGMLKLSGRQWSGWDVWICCLAAILLMDPVAILSQSLWLSAAAVAALIFWYQWFPCPEWQLPPVLRAVVSPSICNWESHFCLCPCKSSYFMALV